MRSEKNRYLTRNLPPAAIKLLSYFLIITLFCSILSPEAQAARKQLIWSLSKQQKFSGKIRITGVPVSCLIGNSQVKGTYVTRVMKDGPAFKSGIRARDVILRVNNKVITNSRQIDSAIQSLRGKTAHVKVARRHGDRMIVQGFNANWSRLASPAKSSASSTSSKKYQRMKVTILPKDHKEKAPPIAQLENLLFNLVNEDRRKNGNLPPYERSSGLSKLARAYATDQANRGFTGHRDPEGRMPQDRARQAGINAFVSENVAWCRSEFLSKAGMVEYCQQSMMNEPPNQMNHRGAILSPDFRYCGVGVGISKDGKVYVCQEFSSTLVP